MKFIYLFLFLFLPFSIVAQQASLTGVVFGENENTPIDYATITIQNTIAGSMLMGTKSKENGSFTISKIPYGKYTVTISSLGYESKSYKNYNIDQTELNLGKIVLNSNSKSLKNVTIVGEKAAIEIGIDKKTFNVDKNITSAGGSAADILKNVPSVNVDMDGNLSLRGKDNVTLLVDGKPSAMFGNDPQTALQSIPASSIESIEVITNPSSKYEAQGMSGIVNIILKKDRKPGYNGTLTLGVSNPFRINGGINFNANIKKWNFFINANGRTARTWEETTTSRSNYENTFTYSSFNHNDRRPLSGFMNLGGDYSINKNNKITFSQNLFSAYMKGNSTTTLENEMDYNTLLSKQIRTNKYIGNPLSGTSNLQYKHNFNNPKEELNIEVNFSKSRYIRKSEYNTSLFDSNEVYVSEFMQKNPILGGNWNGTFQIDYTKPIFKNGRIDIGEKTYYIRFESENQPTIQYPNQAETEEAILKNHYVFTQQVHGVYATIANQFKNTGVQLGLRGEYFTYDGMAYQYNAKVANNYKNIFPTLFISHKINKTQDINFNYARRVNRPGFMQLVPYLDVSNPQDTSQGNPKLKPEFIHAAELTFTKQYNRNDNFIASAYYQYTENLIQRFRRFNPDGTTYSQNQNLATGITYGVELTNKINLLSWWDATVNVNIFRNKINGANIDANLGRTGYGGFAKLVTNAKFKQGFSVQLTSNYNGKTTVAQGTVKPYSNIDIAVKKIFYKNLITLTANVNDLLNTVQTETQYNLYPYYNQTVLRKNQTRSVGLNLQVRLSSKSQRSNTEAPKKVAPKKEKEKETKSRDENLKKDEGGDDNEKGGGNKEGGK